MLITAAASAHHALGPPAQLDSAVAADQLVALLRQRAPLAVAQHLGGPAVAGGRPGGGAARAALHLLAVHRSSHVLHVQNALPAVVRVRLRP